jgi:predicted ABC-type transport system involved in lysophospholipase L1 biosynthesis ATPase subunit
VLLSVSQDTILIAVTHSPSLAERFDRRMRMSDGELVEA